MAPPIVPAVLPLIVLRSTVRFAPVLFRMPPATFPNATLLATDTAVSRRVPELLIPPVCGCAPAGERDLLDARWARRPR